MLGVEIYRDREKGIFFINQFKYIGDILIRFGMSEVYDVFILMVAGIKLDKVSSIDFLSEAEKKEMMSIFYKQAVGSFIFLSCFTRSDLVYSVYAVF